MGRKPEDVFEKIESAKKILRTVYADKSDRDFKRILCHCVYHKQGRKSELLGEEREFYDFLMKNKLNPKTLYEYFLFYDAPDHIKAQLREGKISLREAQSRSFAYKRMITTRNGKDIMQDILNVIRRLEWKGLNNTMRMS